MTCPKCGIELAEGAAFCSECGTNLKTAETPAPAPAPAPAPTYSSAPAPQVVYQQPAPQVVYQVPPPASTPTNADGEKLYPAVSTGEFVGMAFLMMIPLANIILLFVWAFGSATNPSKKNWAKSQLILMLIGIGISLLITILTTVLGVACVGMLDGLANMPTTY